MKIAFVLDQFPRLSETYFLEQIVGLLQAGHQLDIIATIPGGQPKVHPDVARFRLLERTHYTGLPADEGARLVVARRILKKLLDAPQNIPQLLPFPLYGCMTLDHFARVVYGAALFSSFKDTSYDIIHCHYGPNGLMGASLRQLGILRGHLVTTFHGSDAYVYPTRWRVPVYEYLFRSTDLCTVSTDYMKDTVVRLGANADKVKKLPVGLDLKKFAFKPRMVGADGVIKLATVARLVEKKGLEYSIKAVAEVCKRLSTARIQYNIAGDGPRRESLQRLIHDLGMDDHIHLLGWLDQTETAQLLDDSHIFLLPSITGRDGNKEGQALVLQEAQAMGLPVIATIHNGIPEGLLDGKSGLLVPERDVSALAEALYSLVSRPESWHEMGRLGRSFVEQNYDIDMLNRRMIGMYEELVHSGRPEGPRAPERLGKYAQTMLQSRLRGLGGM